MLGACICLYFGAQEGFSLFHARSQECEARSFLLGDLQLLSLQLKSSLACLVCALYYST